MRPHPPVSGSYHPSDVIFLVKWLDIPETPVALKELLIQSQSMHYSEMICPEYMPSQAYLNAFHRACKNNLTAVATNVLQLAKYLANPAKAPILVSLLRAGTPIGVLLKRTLETIFRMSVCHYSISIIRDKGIDQNALDYIVATEALRANQPKQDTAARIVFIDGWTGKGVIKCELDKYVADYNSSRPYTVRSDLHVLADPAGKAEICATDQDYLVPSSALNATISGLVSRSILNTQYIGAGDFHGCKYYVEFASHDLSLWYVNSVMSVVSQLSERLDLEALHVRTQDKSRAKQCDHCIVDIMAQYAIRDINHIKPGLGETTRVLLRRVPYAVIVRDKLSPDVAHILELARARNVAVYQNKEMVYQAIGLIKRGYQ